jgi:shikimate dehydrogenase
MGTRLGVLGWPVAHSRSPAMQNAALRALRLEGWRYQLLPVPPHLFEETVRGLPGSGFVGANATIPHKRAALAIADEAGSAARAIGAANTLLFGPHGEITAENTDAAGLIAALPQPAAGMRALVLGAGGSARAAVWALARAGASEVMVWNRTAARAKELAGELGARWVQRPEPADLLVNCTAVGLAVERSASEHGSLNHLGLTFDALAGYPNVVDLVYRSGSTELLAAAMAHGAKTADGLDVLVAQGALSLELWTGSPAPVGVMREAVREPPRS